MPRVVTVQKTLYEFNELDERAKERARDWYRALIDCDDITSSFDYEDVSIIAGILGITIATHKVTLMSGKTRDEPSIWWSGFASQGDGACFDGSYAYAKHAPANIRKHAPLDEKLHSIADRLADVQRKNFYQVTATSKQRGNYYHSGCAEIEVDRKDYRTISNDDEATVKKALRDFMDWIYQQLEGINDYLYSEEHIDETIIANEYTFDVTGKRLD